MSGSLPVCRHRRGPVAPGRWLCHSPRMVVPDRMVSEADCAVHCPLVDHAIDPRLPVLPMLPDRTVPARRVTVRHHLLSIGLITAPRRVPTVEDTLWQLRRAGFASPIHVFAEPGSDVRPRPGIVVHPNASQLGCWGNWRTAAEWLLEHTDTPYLLLCEDDVLMTPDAAAGLQALFDESPRDWGYASLYTPHRTMEGQPVRRGWQAVDIGMRAWGALALCFTRDALQSVLNVAPPRTDACETDMIVTDILRQQQRPRRFHLPSLAAHSGGGLSTLGHQDLPESRAVDFSPAGAGYETDQRERLTGRLAILTTHFNPVGYRRLRENYHRFAQHVAESGGDLWTAEVAFQDQSFVLPESDRTVHLRSRDVMFVKEQALDVLRRRLPPDVDRVAWIDADILFDRPDWVAAIAQALEEFPVVQCFTRATLLGPEQTAAAPREVDSSSPAAEPRRTPDGTVSKSEIARPGDRDAPTVDAVFVSRAALAQREPIRELHGTPDVSGHPGLAWAARRSVLDHAGFFRHAIIGSGDELMVSGLLGQPEPGLASRYPPGLRQAWQDWTRHVWPLVRGSIGVVEGHVRHLYHGRLRRRAYIEFYDLLRDWKIDVDTVRPGPDGLLEWTRDRDAINEAFLNHFHRRREDD